MTPPTEVIVAPIARARGRVMALTGAATRPNSSANAKPAKASSVMPRTAPVASRA